MNIENAHRLFLMFIGVIGIWSLHVRKKELVLLLRKEFLVRIALLLSHCMNLFPKPLNLYNHS